MTTEPIANGYQVWGHGRSWIIEQYADGALVWTSDWYSDRGDAVAAMNILESKP